ncbi:MAG: helix-turn-helix transcriptional regulator [Taibaiella sp.]|nr:helix-turn-helix transcriptional regulator [Taibaiella sp.]
MYVAKASSTNQANKKAEVNQCPVTFTLHRIGGRWKALILFQLTAGPLRYAALKRAIPAITEKMLIQQLKELETDKLLIRSVKPVVPPHVTYSLTEAGKALAPVMRAMADWGIKFAADGAYNECIIEDAIEQ